MTPLYQTHSIKTNCITDFNGLYYSKEDHVHGLDDVCGLCDALDGKSDIDHLHDKRYYIRGVDTFEFDMQPHTHPIADVCGLCTQLTCIDEKISGKADINHVHSTSEVVDLDKQLSILSEIISGKSDIGHTHDNYPILGEHTHKLSDTCNLVNCLNNKACKNHKHKISDVTNLQQTLNNKSDVGHTHNFWYEHVHSIDEVSGLQTCLDDKACVDHIHCISDITNLQDCLDNKACVNHTHCGSDINIDLSAYASLEYVKSNYTSITVFNCHKHTGDEIMVSHNCGGCRKCVCLTEALDAINCNITCIKDSLCDLNYKLENHWHVFDCHSDTGWITCFKKNPAKAAATYTGLSTDYSSGSTETFNGVGTYQINNNKPVRELVRIVAQMLPPETIQNIIKLENYSGGHYTPIKVNWLETEEELQIPILGGSIVAEYYLKPGESLTITVDEPVGVGPNSEAKPNITVYKYNVY